MTWRRDGGCRGGPGCEMTTNTRHSSDCDACCRGFAHMCVNRYTHTVLTQARLQSKHKICPGVVRSNQTGCQSSASCIFVCLCIRCPGRARGSTQGCRRQVTRRRTVSGGGALGERSEDKAELSGDTRHGTRCRSRRTCTHTHRRSNKMFSYHKVSSAIKLLQKLFKQEMTQKPCLCMAHIATSLSN